MKPVSVPRSPAGEAPHASGVQAPLPEPGPEFLQTLKAALSGPTPGVGGKSSPASPAGTGKDPVSSKATAPQPDSTAAGVGPNEKDENKDPEAVPWGPPVPPATTSTASPSGPSGSRGLPLSPWNARFLMPLSMLFHPWKAEAATREERPAATARDSVVTAGSDSSRTDESLSAPRPIQPGSHSPRGATHARSEDAETQGPRTGEPPRESSSQEGGNTAPAARGGTGGVAAASARNVLASAFRALVQQLAGGRSAPVAKGPTGTDGPLKAFAAKLSGADLRGSGTVLVPFRDATGVSGRIRLALRGGNLHATIFTSDHGTVERLTGELSGLKQALAERGFADAQVQVRNLRPGSSSDPRQDGGDPTDQGPRDHPRHGSRQREDPSRRGTPLSRFAFTEKELTP